MESLVQVLPLELREKIYKEVIQSSVMKKEMQEELFEKWYSLAKRRLQLCLSKTPADIYVVAEHIWNNLMDLNMSKPTLALKQFDLIMNSVKLENRHGPSTRWVFSYHGYTEKYIDRLKLKVEAANVYLKFERYTLNERYGPSPMHGSDGEQPRIFGYILSKHLCYGHEICDLVETTNVKTAGLFIAIQEYDEMLVDATWFGKQALHDVFAI